MNQRADSRKKNLESIEAKPPNYRRGGLFESHLAPRAASKSGLRQRATLRAPAQPAVQVSSRLAGFFALRNLTLNGFRARAGLMLSGLPALSGVMPGSGSGLKNTRQPGLSSD